jgi:hypothetical protein
MTCDHASTRLVAGQMRVDGSKLQRCRLCRMYRRRYRDGGFGPWHERDNGMPEPERREPPPIGSPAYVKETMAALDQALADVPGDQLVGVLREGMAAVDSDRAAARRLPPLARVFSAEIIALARQLSEKRLEVDLLAMRLDRAVEDYNAAHGVGAAESRGALAGVDLQGSRVAWRPCP